MKKIFVLCLLIISLLELCAQEQKPLDGILVIVGKEIILRSDLENAYKDYTSQLEAVLNPEETYCDVLERLMMHKLMLHQAELDSIEVTDQEVEARINRTISFYLQQVGGDPKIIESILKKSIDDIKKDMRENMYETILVEQVQESLTNNIKITPSEVKKFYERVTYDSLPMIPASYEFGHILKTPEVSEVEIEAIKAKLNDYREQALREENKFKMFARLYSDDPGSASNGGDLGFIERGKYFPEFEDAAFKLKTGEISNVVQTQAGYHIIQMIERRGESIKVSHILLQVKPSAEKQVEAIEFLDSVRKVILAENIPFSQAAMKFSDDPNKNSGGWVVNPYTASSKFDRESIEPTVFSTINKLIPGEYSQPVAYINENGIMSYRLIYLKSKVAAHKPNLIEDYDVIQNAALEEKKYKSIDKWIINKVKVTSIRIHDDYKSCSFVKEWQIP